MFAFHFGLPNEKDLFRTGIQTAEQVSVVLFIRCIDDWWVSDMDLQSIRADCRQPTNSRSRIRRESCKGLQAPRAQTNQKVEVE